MAKRSVAVATTPDMFQTTAPPPKLSVPHIGRKSIKVTWPHIYGVTKYRAQITPGLTVDVPGLIDPGLIVEHTFTGLAMDYAYKIQVRAVNQPVSGPEAVGPPAEVKVRTLREWSDPPSKGVDGWNGSTYVQGRTKFIYTDSGIFDQVDGWAKAAIKNGALNALGGLTVDRIQGMTWIEFNITNTPELLITAVVMRAGHTWPQ